MQKREIFGVFPAGRSDFCRLVLKGFSGLIFEGSAGRREGVFCEAEAKMRRRCERWGEGRCGGRVDELDDELFWRCMIVLRACAVGRRVALRVQISENSAAILRGGRWEELASD